MLNFSDVEKKLGVLFVSQSLLITACTHPSYRNEDVSVSEDNERLEFLGDAVLGLIVTEYLFLLFSQIDEGTLSTAKASLVSVEACCGYVMKLGIEKYLRLGKGEMLLGERGKISAYGNFFEAILGAVFLDQGFEVAKRVALPLLPSKEAIIPLMQGNPKNRLQQYTQKYLKELPEYRSYEEKVAGGVVFRVRVMIQGYVRGEGVAPSKKEAEKIAAQQALDHYEHES